MGGGGMENGIANLSRNLPRDKFDLHACCLRSGGAFSNRFENPSQVYSLNKRPGFSIACVRKLCKQIRRIRPDIIHTHNLGPLIYASLASCFGKKQIIVHGEHAELTLADLTLRRKACRKIMYRRCRAIHTVSSQLSAQIIDLGLGKKNIHTIKNGVDSEKFTPPQNKATAKQKLALPGLPEENFIIGSVGRFGTHKRHSMLVTAFDALACLHDEVMLVLAGDGGPEKSATLNAISECKNKDRIHWLGFQKDIRLFYQGIDLLVSPSVNEGMSNAVLEAMACAVPVLANEACGNTEILSGSTGGMMAQMKDASDLTNILDRLVANKGNLEAKGVAARKTVSAQFSIERMVDHYSNLYQAVAGH